jgi:acetyl-CoA carboxylase biotin carboxylase subunit
MLAKLIVYAANRDLAIDRMHRALLELTIDGIESSRDFHLRVMEDEEFRAGAIEIQWLERRLESLIGRKPPVETTRLAALVAALIADSDRHTPRVNGSTSNGREASATPSTDAWTRTARLEALR